MRVRSRTGSARRIWGIFEKVSWVLPQEKTVGFRLLAETRPVALWRVPHEMGCRWKSQNRKNVYLSPNVEEPLNSKVIKNFVPELRSRQLFSCFGCSMYICYEHSMYVSQIRIMGMLDLHTHTYTWHIHTYTHILSDDSWYMYTNNFSILLQEIHTHIQIHNFSRLVMTYTYNNKHTLISVDSFMSYTHTHTQIIILNFYIKYTHTYTHIISLDSVMTHTHIDTYISFQTRPRREHTLTHEHTHEHPFNVSGLFEKKSKNYFVNRH